MTVVAGTSKREPLLAGLPPSRTRRTHSTAAARPRAVLTRLASHGELEVDALLARGGEVAGAGLDARRVVTREHDT